VRNLRPRAFTQRIGRVPPVGALDAHTGGVSFERLVTSIEAVRARKPRCVVAISGFGGSGKSTLADRLRDRFGLTDDQIVRGDRLVSANPRGQGPFDYVDWPLLEQILREAGRAARLTYTGHDYFGNAIAVDAPFPDVLIIEGLRLFRPDAMSRYDLSVWIDIPLEHATRRAKERNIQQGESAYELGLWDTLWAPLDAQYVAQYAPAELASFLYPADGL
jgi:uridine kinase